MTCPYPGPGARTLPPPGPDLSQSVNHTHQRRFRLPDCRTSRACCRALAEPKERRRELRAHPTTRRKYRTGAAFLYFLLSLPIEVVFSVSRHGVVTPLAGVRSLTGPRLSGMSSGVAFGGPSHGQSAYGGGGFLSGLRSSPGSTLDPESESGPRARPDAIEAKPTFRNQRSSGFKNRLGRSPIA